MKNLYILITIIIFYNSDLVAEDWVMDSTATVTTKNINLPDDIKFSALDIKGTWTDNLGFYGRYFCYGVIERDSKNINLNFFCEMENQYREKFWYRGKRMSSDMDAGIGKITFINGLGRYQDIKGVECNYAVRYFDNLNFVKQKCNITQEVMSELKK